MRSDLNTQLQIPTHTEVRTPCTPVSHSARRSRPRPLAHLSVSLRRAGSGRRAPQVPPERPVLREVRGATPPPALRNPRAAPTAWQVRPQAPPPPRQAAPPAGPLGYLRLEGGGPAPSAARRRLLLTDLLLQLLEHGGGSGDEESALPPSSSSSSLLSSSSSLAPCGEMAMGLSPCPARSPPPPPTRVPPPSAGERVAAPARPTWSRELGAVRGAARHKLPPGIRCPHHARARPGPAAGVVHGPPPGATGGSGKGAQ